jgi:TRAP-type C4-dicarboxylate transport system permease small subunit
MTMDGRGLTNRFTHWAEMGAGFFLAFVMLLTFTSVTLRYLFNISIPDAYDLGRNMLGVLIFWGIAVTGFRGEHITVDMVWSALPPKGKRTLDFIGILFTILCMVAFSYAMTGRMLDVYHTGEATYDTSTPIWPFYALAWAGTVAAVILLIVRLVRFVQNPAASEAAPVAASH